MTSPTARYSKLLTSPADLLVMLRQLDNHEIETLARHERLLRPEVARVVVGYARDRRRARTDPEGIWRHALVTGDLDEEEPTAYGVHPATGEHIPVP